MSSYIIDVILLKRGPEGSIPTLQVGEPAFTTDTHKLFVGTSGGNVEISGSGGGGAPTNATYITQTPNSGLSNEQALSLLSTGYLRVTNGTGVLTSVTSIPIVDLPDASDTSKGVVELAQHNESAALLVVQSNDPRLSNSRTPSGAAGGVLSGSYPNPSFAVDMATQSELNDHINDTTAAHAALAISVNPATMFFVSLETEEVQTALEQLDAAIPHNATTSLAGRVVLATDGQNAPNVVVQGNDSRLSNSRPPNGAAGGILNGTFPNPGANVDNATIEVNSNSLRVKALGLTDSHIAAANKDGLAATASLRTLGSGAQQACAGNDSRLTDSRTPSGSAGGDLTGTFPNPTIASLAVTYAKIQNISGTDKILGRSSAGAGVIQEIDCTAAGRALIDDVSASAQRTTLGLGSLATLSTIDTAQINNDAVSYAKIQNVTATDKILGRSTAGAGDVEEIDCTAAGRALLDDANASAQRTTLGLGTAATHPDTDFAGASHGHTGSGDGGSLTTPLITNYLEVSEVAAPGTPSAGRGRIYEKTDNNLYFKNDAGVEYQLSHGLVQTIGVTFDGGGSPITANSKADLIVPFGCIIQKITLLADQSGSIVIDVWKDSYANYPPTNADSITASAKPTISAASKSQDATLTGWTTTIAADDILRFNVDSISTITRVTLVLTVLRT